MKLSVFPFLLLAVSAEVISSRDLQMEESDFPSFVPTVSPPPTMNEGSDPPSDLPSDLPSDMPSGGTMSPAPATPVGATPPPVPVTLTPPPSLTPVEGTVPTAPPLEVPFSSSFVASSCVGLALTVAGLAL